MLLEGQSDKVKRNLNKFNFYGKVQARFVNFARVANHAIFNASWRFSISKLSCLPRICDKVAQQNSRSS